MGWFQRKSEKKSLFLTSIISVVLIFVLFFFGLTYMDPPEENGIAVNFGTSAVGSGTTQPKEPVKTAPTKETTPKQDETADQQEETAEETQSSTEEQDQKAITQEEESPVTSEEKEETKTKESPTEEQEAEEAEKKQESKAEEKTEEEEEEETEPQPEKSTSDALNNVLNGEQQEGKEQKGEGNDQQGGDKGDPSGNRKASSYYGQGKGLDGDGNYRLGGRKALNKKKYVQDCNESGTVVVKIRVNRQGEVVRAEAGVKGTTNTSNCLLEPAKRAALDTQFNGDSQAPSIQTGYIIYEFKLSD